RELKQAVHEMSFRRRCPIVRTDARLEGQFQRAIWLLETWSGGAAVAAELLARAGLAPQGRASVALALFAHHREAAFRADASKSRVAESVWPVRAVMERMARDLVDSDRPRLRAALRLNDDEVRYRAIDGLEALGEDGDAWLDVVRSLVRSSDARL